MDSFSAIMNGMTNRGKELMVFDWNKAARLIKEHKPSSASAGLQGDWEWTGGTIYEDGKPVPAEDTYVYLASTWATPLIELDGEDFECYAMASELPGWDAETYWPESALAILNETAEA